MKRFNFAVYIAAAITISAAIANDRVAFFRAVAVDNERGVVAALREGLDPNIADDRGQTALHLALRDDAPKVAAVLLDDSRTRIDATNAAGETPLMLAALHGRLDWMRRLVERGAAIDREGWSPLHYAAAGPEPRAVALLLDRGAAIDARSPNGTTPLMMAARYGAEASASLLLAGGADLAARNARGLTAADFARDAGRDALAGRLQAGRR